MGKGASCAVPTRVFAAMRSRVGTLRFAHLTRWNQRPSSGLEIIEHSASSVLRLLPGARERSALQRGNRHARKDRILPAEGG